MRWPALGIAGGMANGRVNLGMDLGRRIPSGTDATERVSMPRTGRRRPAPATAPALRKNLRFCIGGLGFMGEVTFCFVRGVSQSLCLRARQLADWREKGLSSFWQGLPAFCKGTGLPAREIILHPW